MKVQNSLVRKGQELLATIGEQYKEEFKKLKSTVYQLGSLVKLVDDKYSFYYVVIAVRDSAAQMYTLAVLCPKDTDYKGRIGIQAITFATAEEIIFVSDPTEISLNIVRYHLEEDDYDDDISELDKEIRTFAEEGGNFKC